MNGTDNTLSEDGDDRLSDRPPESIHKTAPFEYSWVYRSKEPSHGSRQGTTDRPPSLPDPAAWRRALAAVRAFGAKAAARAEHEVLDGTLIRDYWRSAWAFAVGVALFATLWGSWSDRLLVTGWLAVTLAAHWYSRRASDVAVAVHLVAAFPTSLLYLHLTSGGALHSVLAPAQLAFMLAFPGLLLVAFWGPRGLLALLLLGIGSEAVLHAGRHTTGLVAWALLPAGIIGAVIRNAILRLGELERRSANASSVDPVTGLANRRAIYQSARAWQSERGGAAIALTLGINRFSAVNTILGRSAADELLAQVAIRLAQAAGPGATVARLGGDEFLVFAPDATVDAARRLAKHMLARLRAVFSVRGHAVHVSACVGIAAYPDHGTDIEDLVRYADAAMQRAKESGNAIEEISWNGSERVSRAMMLEAELRQAVLEQKLTVEFQPVLDLATGRFAGAEALARWVHPEMGRIGPDVFIPLAEDAGIVPAIDELVMRRALDCREEWARHGWDGWVSVNLSAESFGNPDIVGTLGRILAEAGTSARTLVIELTESRAMRNPEASAAMLANMKEAGVGVALDDFGMGYSSLAYLKIFPVDHLKLDRMFVQGIGIDVRDEHLLEAIIELAHRRGVTIVAEGVETPAQLRWLREHGCEYAQGYLLGCGMPSQAFSALVLGASSDGASLATDRAP